MEDRKGRRNGRKERREREGMGRRGRKGGAKTQDGRKKRTIDDGKKGVNGLR